MAPTTRANPGPALLLPGLPPPAPRRRPARPCRFQVPPPPPEELTLIAIIDHNPDSIGSSSSAAYHDPIFRTRWNGNVLSFTGEEFAAIEVMIQDHQRERREEDRKERMKEREKEKSRKERRRGEVGRAKRVWRWKHRAEVGKGKGRERGERDEKGRWI